jgi:hypothetical protein
MIALTEIILAFLATSALLIALLRMLLHSPHLEEIGRDARPLASTYPVLRDGLRCSSRSAGS